MEVVEVEVVVVVVKLAEVVKLVEEMEHGDGRGDSES